MLRIFVCIIFEKLKKFTCSDFFPALFPIMSVKNVFINKKAASHNENRYKICLFCHKKPHEAHVIQGVIVRRITSLVSDYDLSDPRLPTVVCNSCRIKLIKADRNNACLANITIFDYSDFSECDISNEGVCECNLCKIVRARFGKFTIKDIRKEADDSVERRCTKCFVILGPGKRHPCNGKELIKNLSKASQSYRSKAVEKVTFSLMKTAIADKTAAGNASASKSMYLTQNDGRPLKVSVQYIKKRSI